MRLNGLAILQMIVLFPNGPLYLGSLLKFPMLCIYIYTYGTRNPRIPSSAQKTRCLRGKPWVLEMLGFHHVPLLAPCCHFGFFVTMIRKKNAWALRLEKGLEGWIGKLWDPKATSYVKDYRFPIYVSFKVFHPSHSSTLGTVYVTKFGPLVIGTL